MADSTTTANSARNRGRTTLPSQQTFTMLRSECHVYRLLGPARRSLHLEICLWCVLLLMIISNMQGVYKKSFGTQGDFVLILFAAVWLSKHVFLRWIASWDPSTVQSPTLFGLLSHLTTNHLMGGQIYDRPPPRQIAKFLAIKDDSAPLLQSAQSTSDYARKLWNRGGGGWVPKTYRWLQTRFGSRSSNNNSNNNHNSNNRAQARSIPKQPLGVANKPRSKFGRLLAKYQPQWAVVRQNIPNVQFLIYCAGLFIIKGLVRRRVSGLYRKETQSTYLYSASLGVPMKQEANMMKRKGDYYPRSLAESWWEDAWVDPVIGFMALIMWIFARVVPPLPDLLAGGHPAKDLRNDKTESGSRGSTGGNNGGNTNNSRGNNNNNNNGGGLWSRFAALGFVAPTVHSWAESQAPISSVPRMHVHTAVFLLRMIDILWVVLFLPRCDSVCQLTGHCTSAWDWAERSYYLYPVGITSPQRPGRPHRFFPNRVDDDFSFYLTAVNLLITASILLWAQTILTNRTFWASWGLCAEEWKLLPAWHPLNGKTDGRSNWDPKRKYKEGDTVVFEKRAFQATIAEPQGRPYLGLARTVLQCFAREVGHPATSNILSWISGVQVFSFICNFLLWYDLRFYSVDCHGVFVMVLAVGLAAYVLAVVGSTPPSGLAHINAQVTGQS